jgi:hypothetical protein
MASRVIVLGICKRNQIADMPGLYFVIRDLDR